MGFWDVVGRMAQGKPAFEDTNQMKGSNVVSPASKPIDVTKTPVDGSGRKQIPRVTLENCKSRSDGIRMETTVWITNRSEHEIELDKIVVVGTKMELDRRLAAGQGHEVRVYSGSVPRHNQYHTASLYYRLVRSDDYFQADFMVEYDYRPDGTHLVEEFHPEPHVRDI